MHSYDLSVKWKTDRIGIMSSEVLNQTMEVATPPEFPKGVEGVWSPEHLFVAAVNSCLMTTFLAVAENSNLNFIDFDSKAIGILDKVDGKFMMNQVKLMPIVTVAEKKDADKALRLLEKSEAACLISNSIKSEIIFEPQIKVAVNA
jgi:peroxiredoxin-like protein